MSWEQEVNYRELRKLYTEAEEELQETLLEIERHHRDFEEISQICKDVLCKDYLHIVSNAVAALGEIRGIVG